jgi:hypothetical protein
MALSTCAKCGGHAFEVELIEPVDARYKQNLIQCTACGVPIGAIDSFNIGSQLDELHAQIKAAIAGIEELKHRVIRIEHAVSRSA